MNNKSTTYLCYAIMALFATSSIMMGPLLIGISNTFSLSLVQTGIIFTANFLGLAIFVLAGGLLADLVSKKAILSISLFGFSAALIILPLTRDFVLFCIVIAFIGGFGGILEGLISSLVHELNQQNKNFYVNMTQVFFGIGAVLGAVVGGLAISFNISWKVCYDVVGIFAIILTVLFVNVKYQPAASVERYKLSSFAYLLKDRKFMFICLCMVFYTGSEIASWGWMSTFLTKSLNFTVVKSGIAVGAFWVAMTLGRLYCGKLTLKYDTRYIIIVLALASSVATAISGIVYAEVAVWMVIVAIGLTYSSQWPLIVAYGGDYSKSSSGLVFSFLLACGGIGITVVPYFIGVIAEKMGIRAAMASPAILLFFVAIIFMFFKPAPKVKEEALK